MEQHSMISLPERRFSVFTKAWREMEAAALGELVAGMGFDGIELPVRPGYQVEPENVGRDLLGFVRRLGEQGVTVHSVAGPADEATIVACAEAGVRIIRTLVEVGEAGYTAAEQDARRRYDTLLPVLDEHGVTIGVQNHSARFVCNAMGLWRLLQGYEPRHVAAVWDPAHTALDGEEPEMALEIVWPHLCMVNLKNAFWRRVNGPEAEWVQWETYWTSGAEGLAPWPRVAKELLRRNYNGVLCLTAEYSDSEAVARLARQDLVFAKALFAQENAS